jgi:hypothetical protein
MSEKRRGSLNPQWKGGRTRVKGYILSYAPEHPFASALNYVLEHRLIMEQMLGRFLTKDEIVHHLNGQRDDNRPENLELFSKSHPCGQRIEDKLKWAKELITLYGEDFKQPGAQKMNESAV